MMIRLAALTVLLTLGAFGQDTSDRKVVEVKYLSGPRFDQAVKLLNQFLHPGQASGDPELHAVLLRGNPEAIVAAEALLRKFDVPVPGRSEAPPVKAQSYQLRIYMVEGLANEPSTAPVPTDIQAAVEQMKKTFLYKGYRLMDTVLIQTETHSQAQPMIYNAPSAAGMLASDSSASRLPITYQVQIGDLFATEEGKILQLKRFRLQLRVPVSVSESNTQYVDASVSSDLSLRVGQKLVIGKLSGTSSASAIFCILTAEPTN